MYNITHLSGNKRLYVHEDDALYTTEGSSKCTTFKHAVPSVIHVLFLLLLQIHQHVDCEIIYITPSLNTSCPQRSCSTFMQYTSNPNPVLTSGATARKSWP